MTNPDPNLEKQVQKLHQLTIYGRWLFVLLCWLVFVPYGLWELRDTISYCQDYCTWAAIRLGLQFNPFATLALAFTIGMTTAVLVWQSRIILGGDLSPKQRYFLEQKVIKIQQMGPKHPLWKWVCK